MKKILLFIVVSIVLNLSLFSMGVYADVDDTTYKDIKKHLEETAAAEEAAAEKAAAEEAAAEEVAIPVYATEITPEEAKTATELLEESNKEVETAEAANTVLNPMYSKIGDIPAEVEKAADAKAQKEEADAKEAQAEADADKQPSLKDATFDISKYLTLDGQGEFLDKKGEDDKTSPIVKFLVAMINFAVSIIGSIAVLLLVIAGFMFMFAQGNQQSIDNAKEVVKYAVIGLVVTFLSFIIVVFVQSILSSGVTPPT